jgi:microcystin-dependent protein
MFMKKRIVVIFIALSGYAANAQNVGIGTTTPVEKLEVNGNVKANTISVVEGNQYDVLKKGAGNAITYNKGTKAIGINYIIAVQGVYPPNPPGTPAYNNIIIGEIRLFAGNYAPVGFMFCNGQVLSISSNSTLFQLIGTQYGGNGSTTFALPDLRGAVPVGTGTPANGAAWGLGEVN